MGTLNKKDIKDSHPIQKQTKLWVNIRQNLCKEVLTPSFEKKKTKQGESSHSFKWRGKYVNVLEMPRFGHISHTFTLDLRGGDASQRK